MGLGVAGTAAAIGAAGSIGSTLIGGAMQHGSVNAGLSQARADLAPWRTAGTNALGVASDLAGANGPDAAQAAMANFYTDPGYQFQLQQGLRGIDAGAASKGLLHSGATIKAEEEFGQGLASSDFQNYYSRLYGLANMGESAATGSATASTNAATQNANITGNTASTIGNSINSLMQNPGVVNGIGGLFGSTVSPSTVQQNALYQQGAFSAAGPGAYGPFL